MMIAVTTVVGVMIVTVDVTVMTATDPLHVMNVDLLSVTSVRLLVTVIHATRLAHLTAGTDAMRVMTDANLLVPLLEEIVMMSAVTKLNSHSLPLPYLPVCP